VRVADELLDEVLAANLALVGHRLVTLTWGNASAIDRAAGLVAIKPSGVSYDEMTRDDLVIVDLEGNLVEGSRRPSTDTPTHVYLYREVAEIGGIIHTHSTWAAAWAQSNREIPILGTTHADLAPAAIPITRPLTDAEVAGAYEENTGVVLREAIGGRGIDAVPGALVAGHGPFVWGATVTQALERAVTLEEVAHIAALTVALNPDVEPLSRALRDRHFRRKHGPSAYYGQRD
jgi:L-ribulose-5-phosphate 4-epimerase